MKRKGMKRKGLYICAVSAMISLCGCGGANAISGKAAKDAMDFYETEAPTEDSAETSAERPTETLADTGQTEKEDQSVIGMYIPQGYENDYLSYRIDLPESFTLKSRGAFNPADAERVIETANDPSTVDFLYSSLKLGNAEVFEAESDSGYMTVSIEGLSPLEDYWDEEEVLAANAEGKMRQDLQGQDSDTVKVTEIDTRVDYLDDFLGEKHYAVLYSCQTNGTPVYGMEVIVRSADRQYVSLLDFMSTDVEELEQMTGYCSAM